jgi:hypothetical protein
MESRIWKSIDFSNLAMGINCIIYSFYRLQHHFGNSKITLQLERMIGCTDNKHSWSEVVNLQQLLSVMIGESGSDASPINEPEFDVISCEFYPQYKSSLLESLGVTDIFVVNEGACE